MAADTAQAAAGTALPPFKRLPFKGPDIEVRRGAKGEVYLFSRIPPGPAPRSIPHLLDEKAAEHPDRPWLKQREPNHGPWRQVTYGEGARSRAVLAQALIDRGLGPDAPLLILSGNSIEHALMSLAAQRIGAPATPISMAYSLMSTDFAKLKHCFNAVKPKAVFVQAMEPFRKALAQLPLEGVAVISVDGGQGSEDFYELAKLPATSAVDTAMERLGPDSVGKYLFTSGSTGMPKPAPQSQGAMTAQIACRKGLDDHGPEHDPNEILQNLDWMPWSHISGGNVNFNGCISLGGVFHIDEGRPMPGLFQTTMKNLREIRPQYFGSAPIAYAMLAEAMEGDAEFRDAFFSRMKYMVYGGATLSDDLYDRIQALAIASTAMRIPLTTMYGATETQGVTMVHWQLERVGMVGLPLPGLTLKLVPTGAKMEVRVKGPTVMKGYLNLPEKNAQAFDEEGYLLPGRRGALLRSRASRERPRVRRAGDGGLQAQLGNLGVGRHAAAGHRGGLRASRGGCGGLRAGQAVRRRTGVAIAGGDEKRDGGVRRRRGRRGRRADAGDRGEARGVQRDAAGLVAESGALQGADHAAVARCRRDHRQGLCQPARRAGPPRGRCGGAVRGGASSGVSAGLTRRSPRRTRR